MEDHPQPMDLNRPEVKDAFKKRIFRYQLNRDTYKRILLYLADKLCILRFSWCLEQFKPHLIANQ